MSPTQPLPFRIRVPGKDVIDFKGIRSVKYRVEGLLNLVDDLLTFEWTATEKTERVGFTGIHTDVDRSPIGRIEVPTSWLVDVCLRRSWWRQRLVFQARRLDAFEGMPGAKGGALTLRVPRRFRHQAKTLIAAIEQANLTTPLATPDTLPELERGDVTQLDDSADT